MTVLTAHSWPGNVREMENAIKRAIILSNDLLLTADDFNWLAAVAGDKRADAQEISLESLIDAKLRSSLNNIEVIEKGEIHALVLEQVERPLLRLILEKTRWNQVKAADILGINRNTLRKKIHELGITLKRD